MPVEPAELNMEALSRMPNPGRGIFVGQTEAGIYIAGYFITGRSEGTQNRILVRKGSTIRTDVHHPMEGVDTSLLLYNAFGVLGFDSLDHHHFLSNGDHTDVIKDHLRRGGSLESALKTQHHEPDAPTWTPRIGANLTLGRRGSERYVLGKVVPDEANPPYKDGEGGVHLSSQRAYYPSKFTPGYAKMLHTYMGGPDNPPLPFRIDPYAVKLDRVPEDIALTYWQILEPQRKVLLLVKAMDPNGQVEYYYRDRWGNRELKVAA